MNDGVIKIVPKPQHEFKILAKAKDGTLKEVSLWQGTCGCPVIPRIGDTVVIEGVEQEVLGVIWDFTHLRITITTKWI